MLSKNISLKNYNTFGWITSLSSFISVKSENEAIKVIQEAGSSQNQF